MHPALPVKTSVTQLGFPYRPSLKSQRAARLEGKRLHAAHRPSEAANALCRVKRQTTRITSGSRSYTWQQKSFTFPPQDFIFCAKPVSDVTSKPLNSSFGVFLSKKKVPFPGGRKLQTAVWFDVCVFLKMNEKCSGWIRSNNM